MLALYLRIRIFAQVNSENGNGVSFMRCMYGMRTIESVSIVGRPAAVDRLMRMMGEDNKSFAADVCGLHFSHRYTD